MNRIGVVGILTRAVLAHGIGVCARAKTRAGAVARATLAREAHAMGHGKLELEEAILMVESIDG